MIGNNVSLRMLPHVTWRAWHELKTLQTYAKLYVAYTNQWGLGRSPDESGSHLGPIGQHWLVGLVDDNNAV